MNIVKACCTFTTLYSEILKEHGLDLWKEIFEYLQRDTLYYRHDFLAFGHF